MIKSCLYPKGYPDYSCGFMIPNGGGMEPCCWQGRW